MSKSRKRTKHYMDEGSKHKTKGKVRKQKWDWRYDIEKDKHENDDTLFS